MNENATDEAMDAAYEAADAARDAGASAGTSVKGTANQLFLAGLGAVALTLDTLDDTFDRLVDRGQEAQQDLQQQANQARARRRMGRGRVSDAFRSGMDAFLDALSVPNKADVDTINVKLNILNRKLDDLTVSETGGGPTGQPDIGGETGREESQDPDLAT